MRKKINGIVKIVTMLFGMCEHLSSLSLTVPSSPSSSLPSSLLPSSLLPFLPFSSSIPPFLPLGSNRQSMLSLNSGSQEFDTASLRDDMISVSSETPKHCVVLYSYKVSGSTPNNILTF